jgi:diguanylate cyclase (GGDEF)-like protein
MSGLAFEWEIPEILAQADHLPSPPAVAAEILRLTRDEESSIADLAECISRDPALAAKMLKLANSSRFSMGREITTLERATRVLGLKTAKLMSLGFSLVGAVPMVAGLDYKRFWHRSLVRAVSSRALAELFSKRCGDEAFLCGLLNHFGKLVLAQVLPDEYEALLEEYGGMPSIAIETSRLGFSSTDLCATLLKAWDMPALIYMAVGYANRTDELENNASEDIQDDLHDLVEIFSAATCVEELLCDATKAPALQELHRLAEDRLGVPTEDMDAFLVSLQDGISETAELLSVSLPEDLSHEKVVEQARMQIVNVSLGTAMDLQNAGHEHEKVAATTMHSTDHLTGLPNRAAFDDFFHRQAQSRLNGKSPRALGVILIEVDRFKSFNDAHRHQAGDKVLRMLGSVLLREVRKGDLVARFGGEQFVLVAPHTNPFGLKTMAERLRKAIAAESIEFEGTTLSVTASFGAACIARFHQRNDADQLIELAERFLHKAKENGRNRCEVFNKVQFPARQGDPFSQ